MTYPELKAVADYISSRHIAVPSTMESAARTGNSILLAMELVLYFNTTNFTHDGRSIQTLLHIASLIPQDFQTGTLIRQTSGHNHITDPRPNQLRSALAHCFHQAAHYLVKEART